MTFFQFIAEESAYSFGYLLTLFVLGLMFVTIFAGNVIPRQQKFGFFLCALFITLTSSAEWLGVFFDNATGYRFLHTLVKLLELSLTPTIPVLMGYTIGGLRRYRLFAAILIFSFLLEGVLLPSGVIFFLDQNDIYQHGRMYWIYPFLLIAGSIFLCVELFLQAKKLQNQKYGIVFLIVLLPMLSFIVHLMIPEIRFSWLSVSIALSLIYNYYCNLFLSMDHLTSLLNRGSFDNDIERMRVGNVLIELDIDKFKALNDNYGHDVGDHYLREIATMICAAYKCVGRCYRIGGDEFAVIVNRGNADYQKSTDVFLSLLSSRRKEDPSLPHISLGYCVYDGKESFKNVYKYADMDMYKNKAADHKLNP